MFIVAVVSLAAFGVIVARRRVRSAAAERLRRLCIQRPDYRIFVGVPIASPKEWAVAIRQGEDTLVVHAHGTLRISDVRAFVVAYANGQLLDYELCGLPMPEGLGGLWPSAQADSDILHIDDLEPGRAYIQIAYGPSVTRSQDCSYYATTLKNISTECIRVHRFAGYSQSGKSWILSTVTSQFYSSDEFREWYGLGPSEWIEPGQAVTDHNNYGSLPVLWAYYCESASGKQFVAGGVLE